MTIEIKAELRNAALYVQYEYIETNGQWKDTPYVRYIGPMADGEDLWYKANLEVDTANERADRRNPQIVVSLMGVLTPVTSWAQAMQIATTTWVPKVEPVYNQSLEEDIITLMDHPELLTDEALILLIKRINARIDDIININQPNKGD